MSSKDFEFKFEDVDNELHLEEPAELVEEEEVPEVEATEGSEDIPEATRTEYLMIFDSIMFEDVFTKVYKLGNKYSATFSTRSADDDMKISRQLDGMNFSTMHAFQTMSAVLTMSHSLVGLNGKDMSDMTVTERYTYIRSKSSHLIELLSDRMIQFDQLVRNALGYGEVNF